MTIDDVKKYLLIEIGYLKGAEGRMASLGQWYGAAREKHEREAVQRVLKYIEEKTK